MWTKRLRPIGVFQTPIFSPTLTPHASAGASAQGATKDWRPGRTPSGGRCALLFIAHCLGLLSCFPCREVENTESAENTPGEGVWRSGFSAVSPLRLLCRRCGVRQGRQFPVAGYTAAAGGGVPGKRRQRARVRQDADWANQLSINHVRPIDVFQTSFYF